ncbi:MAG: putative cysteine desulfurase [Chlamydiae bacterium]|nr:putative cysteine desulfurase [Chlamydiota bacterium]
MLEDQMIDLKKIRQDTPGSSQRIHFNNAGSSLPPQQVIRKMEEYLELEAQIGGYNAADESKSEINSFYVEAAKLINASSVEEIAFSESATHAWQKIFYSLELGPKDTIILFDNEYISFYLSVLQQQKRIGFKPVITGSNEQGDIDLDTFKKTLDSSVKAVLLGHMPTQSGILNPAEEVGAILQDHSAKYILDATQTVGQYPIDVEKIQCDALCGTGRKFLRGPRGTGFLYAKQNFAESLNPVVIDLGSAHWTSEGKYDLFPGTRRFECWEKNYAAMIGLTEAIRYANELGIENIWERTHKLGTMLREGLRNIDGVTICDPGTKHGAIVTFTLKGHSCLDIMKTLYQQNITIHYSMREYAPLDFGKRGLEEACRASPHYFNLEEEVDQVIHAIKHLAC